MFFNVSSEKVFSREILFLEKEKIIALQKSKNWIGIQDG
jgi:hypothetical protein